MNPVTERFSDLVDDGDDPALLRCVADLDATCAVFALSPERDASLTHRLAAQADDPKRLLTGTVPARRRWLRVPWQTARWRLASLVLAVLVAGGGIGAYLQGQNPTPVDAQTVLHQAAAVSPGPNEATHATYRLSASGGLTGTADVWIGFDGSGAPSQLALTQTTFKDGTLAPELSLHVAAADRALFDAYDPARNPITVSSSGTPGQALEGMLVGTLLAQKLSRQPHSFDLRQETLDGVSVYALTLDATPGQTYYFNAQSYLLEGVDWVQAGRSWQARLDPASYHIMALSAVPSDTFPAMAGGVTASGAITDGQRPSGAKGGGMSIGLSVGRPASGSTAGGVSFSLSSGGPSGSGAHLTISVSIAGLQGSGVDLMPAMVAACNTNPQTFAAAVQAGDRSMLTICQETNPGISADRLVTALMAPVKSALDAQVTAGAITPVQEDGDLANLRPQLTHLVTTPMRVGQPPAGTGVQQP